MIHHLSLDFWKTLAIPNPEFSKARFKLLEEYSGLTLEGVKYLYGDIKNALDEDALNGITQSCFEAYLMLAIDLRKDWTIENIRELVVNINYQFFKHPPMIPEETIKELRKLKSKGISLSIGSNTNFVPGSLIKQAVLDPLDVDFAFVLFSDELGFAKPSLKFFHTVIENTKKFYIEREDNAWAISGSNICHLGDSKLFDAPAVKSGMEFVLVNGPHKLAEVLAKF